MTSLNLLSKRSGFSGHPSNPLAPAWVRCGAGGDAAYTGCLCLAVPLGGQPATPPVQQPAPPHFPIHEGALGHRTAPLGRLRRCEQPSQPSTARRGPQRPVPAAGRGGAAGGQWGQAAGRGRAPLPRRLRVAAGRRRRLLSAGGSRAEVSGGGGGRSEREARGRPGRPTCEAMLR